MGRKLDPSASLNAGFHQVHRACFAGSTHCLSTRTSRSARLDGPSMSTNSGTSVSTAAPLGGGIGTIRFSRSW